MSEFDAIARLIDAMRPWLRQVVLVGGWAHRLQRFHELAHPPAYSPLRTKDADIAFSTKTPLEGDIAAALKVANFTEELSGEDKPPITHYRLAGERGEFYAEFLVPLVGGEFNRKGERDVTVSQAGITAQRLRHLDLLLTVPWAVWLDETVGVPLNPRAEVRFANPVSFVAQKLLIQKYRSVEKQAQDALYIHDTLELFAPELGRLNDLWRDRLKDTLPSKTVKDLERIIHDRFDVVTDVLRSAALIPQDRTLRPERMQQASAAGLEAIFLA